MTKNALVTVNYAGALLENSRNSFIDAAKRWGCDFLEINEKVWKGPVSAPAMKLKVFDFCDAERVMVIDADTVISGSTPSPFETFPEDAFTACINKQLHMGSYCGTGLILERKEMENIMTVGLFPRIEFDHLKYFNSGFWVGCRKLHEDVLWRALEIWSYTPNLGWHDQSPLNYAITESKSRLVLADIAWNYCFPNQLPDWLNMKKYVYHFAGMPSRYDDIPRINWRV